MKQHPLTNKKTFSEFLSTLSCRYCIFLLDERCIHETAEENEKSKDWIRENDKQRGYYEKAVNDYFLCYYFDNGKKDYRVKS